jgi:hypothetical protein
MVSVSLITFFTLRVIGIFRQLHSFLMTLFWIWNRLTCRIKNLKNIKHGYITKELNTVTAHWVYCFKITFPSIRFCTLKCKTSATKLYYLIDKKAQISCISLVVASLALQLEGHRFKQKPENSYPYWGFSWFSSVPPHKCQDSRAYLKLGHDHFLPYHTLLIILSLDTIQSELLTASLNKSKAVLLHAMETLGGRGIAPTHSWPLH